MALTPLYLISDLGYGLLLFWTYFKWLWYLYTLSLTWAMVCCYFDPISNGSDSSIPYLRPGLYLLLLFLTYISNGSDNSDNSIPYLRPGIWAVAILNLFIKALTPLNFISNSSDLGYRLLLTWINFEWHFCSLSFLILTLGLCYATACFI